MRVTALEPQQHHPERVNVYIDGEFGCGLAAEIAFSAGLEPGAEIDEPTLDALVRRDLRWKARDSALNLLSHRARSEAELRRRLRRKGYPEEIIDACTAELAERGLIDDEGFASSFVRDRVRLRPRGPRRLVQELRARGVDDDLARQVVRRVLAGEQVSELDLARDAAAAWARRTLPKTRRAGRGDAEVTWKARRRLYAYLGRRGFGGDIARKVMDEVIGQGGN